MAFFFKKKKKERDVLPLKISLVDLMDGNPSTSKAFCQSLKDYRFAVLKCDEKTIDAIANYKKVGSEFFSLDNDYKMNYSGGQIDEIVTRKVNKGYLCVKGMKEFLKLQANVDIKDVPSQPTQLQNSFQNVVSILDSIAKTCLDNVAKYEVDGKTFMESNFYEMMKQKLFKSSLSLIHYFPMPECSPDETFNNSNADEYVDGDDEQKDKITEGGLTYPSKTHTDTGILTLIICAEVPGLQVWDVVNQKWLEVEKMVTPKEDLFVIVGRKTQLFSKQRDSTFKPTTHRVALPLNTERSSLLYFLDVPQ